MVSDSQAPAGYPDGRRRFGGPFAVSVGVATTGWALLGGLTNPVARAAQTDIMISMAAPGAAPRILGPGVIAAKPATPFLYTLAATGGKPLTFAASGLPTGLSVNSTTGTITGIAPTAGSYPIMVTVTNTTGTVQRGLSLVVGDTLALTPPMGWNSYDSFGGGVTEAEVIAAAQAQAAQLQPFGWNYVVVDYLWFDPSRTSTPTGACCRRPRSFHRRDLPDRSG